MNRVVIVNAAFPLAKVERSVLKRSLLGGSCRAIEVPKAHTGSL